MKLGGIFCQKEAKNFLLGKPEDPYITSYANHVSSHPSARKAPQHAIVPDLHEYNFPAGKQTTNDSGGNTMRRNHLRNQNVHCVLDTVPAEQFKNNACQTEEQKRWYWNTTESPRNFLTMNL